MIITSLLATVLLKILSHKSTMAVKSLKGMLDVHLLGTLVLRVEFSNVPIIGCCCLLINLLLSLVVLLSLDMLLKLGF